MKIGKQIVTDNGTGTIIESRFKSGKNTVDLHMVDFGDHYGVVAQEYAFNWVVGDEKDMKRNFDTIEVVGADRLADFAKSIVREQDLFNAGWTFTDEDGNVEENTSSRRVDLHKWIVDRIEDAKAYRPKMDKWTKKELTEFLAWCTPSVAWEALTALTAAAMGDGRIDANELIAKTRKRCGMKS